jgi:hypothetical protein
MPGPFLMISSKYNPDADTVQIITEPLILRGILEAEEIDPQHIRRSATFTHGEFYAVAAWTETGLALILVPKKSFSLTDFFDFISETLGERPELN